MAARLSPTEKIQSSLLKLASKGPREEIDLVKIAKHAGVGVGEITALYGSSYDILCDFIARLDEESVSVSDFSETDTVHDKLFDLLMKRLESLQEHKPALRNLVASGEGRETTSFYTNEPIVKTMGWMLEVAGVKLSGLEGEARRRGLAWAFGHAFETFLEEDDPGLSKTMMVLDRSLSRLVVWQERFDGGLKLVKGAGSLLGALIENVQQRNPARDNGAQQKDQITEK